jgi:hypothetical protein
MDTNDYGPAWFVTKICHTNLAPKSWAKKSLNVSSWQILISKQILAKIMAYQIFAQ